MCFALSMHTHTYVRTVHTYIHIHTYTYMHTHIYTYMHISVSHLRSHSGYISTAQAT